MKCSESWLREWVNPAFTRDQLSTALTMAGLEVEEVTPVAKECSGIVVGQVITVDKHPEAQRLHVCDVDVGLTHPLKIVCGAENVRLGMKVPVAMIDAVLPNKLVITRSTIRGIESHGMLCSASELGLAEESQGLFELAQDAPIGQDLASYLNLNDYIIDISITPNRGDCLSIKGVAREISALTHTPLLENNIATIVEPAFPEAYPIIIEDKVACPSYVGRVIRGVKADAAIPVWLTERLRRSGIRSISAIVDVTNYVMLELGQPMHAFDLHTIHDAIHVRQSKPGEKIALLDGSEKELDAQTLVIADKDKPLAIAGVMGGLDSSVTLTTTDILLESAFFMPEVVARQRQYYGLLSESAYRFERGVDSTIQSLAIERATQLILEIAGGKAGPVLSHSCDETLPKQPIISLTPEKIEKVLGISIADEEVERIFKALAFTFNRKNDTWMITVPPYRFDMTLPEDVIEEIARIHGYDKIPTHTLKAELQVAAPDEGSRDLHLLRQVLIDQGYHEIISYSFVDKALQKHLDPERLPYELVNPITADMSVMRTNLWPGLVRTFLYNKSRQQQRIRLFEIGTCFVNQGDHILQQSRLGGLIAGYAVPEQWGSQNREVDFFDLKGSLEQLLHPLAGANQLIFKSDTHPSLHPGQTAGIFYQGQRIGICGLLHPVVMQALEVSGKVFVYELDISGLMAAGISLYQDISKFPEIRRDLAILVNESIPASEIQDTIKEIAGDWLKDVFIFDVYQGKGVSPGLKSIALALVLQHSTRTLVDEEVTALLDRVMATLKGTLGAELRR